MDPFIAILVIFLATLVILASLNSELSREAEQAALLFFTDSGRENVRNRNASGR